MWRSTFLTETIFRLSIRSRQTDRGCWTIHTHSDERDWARRRTFHDLNSISLVRLMKSSTFGLGLSGFLEQLLSEFNMHNFTRSILKKNRSVDVGTMRVVTDRQRWISKNCAYIKEKIMATPLLVCSRILFNFVSEASVLSSSSLNFTGSKKRNKLNNVMVSSKITSTFELPDWKSFINGNYL